MHQADALGFDYAALKAPGLRVIGNLPYYLSTPLLFRLLEGAAGFRDMIVMLQREVAERLCASPGSRRYGRLTVMTAVRARPDRAFRLRRDAFEPRPRVESTVVRLVPDTRIAVRRPGAFERLVRQAFSKRRKTIANALRGMAGRDRLAQAGIDPSLRAEQIDVAAYLRLSETLD